MIEGRRIAFGTDGVRGVANEGLKPEDALVLGLAGARFFGGPLVIGRDTRLSSGMLSAALVAGATSGGARVLDLGVLPTPGVATLASALGASAAAVVSNRRVGPSVGGKVAATPTRRPARTACCAIG